MQKTKEKLQQEVQIELAELSEWDFPTHENILTLISSVGGQMILMGCKTEYMHENINIAQVFTENKRRNL